MNNQRGFIALTMVITIASLILAFSYMQSISIAHFFDMTRTKEYRFMNYYNAYSCIDQAVLNLSHDFFYEVAIPHKISELDCFIDAIKKENDLRIIETHGNYKNIDFKRKAKVRLYDDRLVIELIE